MSIGDLKSSITFDRRTKPGDLYVDWRSKIVDQPLIGEQNPATYVSIGDLSPLIGEQNLATYVSIGDLKSSITLDRRTKLGDLCVDRRSKIVDHLSSANKLSHPFVEWRSEIVDQRAKLGDSCVHWRSTEGCVRSYLAGLGTRPRYPDQRAWLFRKWAW